MGSFKIWAKGLLLGSLLLGTSSCLQRNAEGRQTLLLESDQKLQAEASAVYAEQIAQGKLSTNSRQNKIVQRVGRRIIEQAERIYPDHCKGFAWEVNLLESEEANAYCMPGGKIAVYTGILKICENEAALGAVMGHEVAHALLDHGNERVSQAKMVSIGMALAQVATENTKVVDDKYKNIVLSAVGLGAQVGILLPYSRAHETEADRMGLRLSAAAGYDPAEAPHLWERMKQLGGGAPMEFLSTHPDSGRRIADLQALQMEVVPLYQASGRYGLGDRL